MIRLYPKLEIRSWVVIQVKVQRMMLLSKITTDLVKSSTDFELYTHAEAVLTKTVQDIEARRQACCVLAVCLQTTF